MQDEIALKSYRPRLTAFAPDHLRAMLDLGGGYLDVNALEAASIPEPSRAMLLLLGGVAVLMRRRVR